MIIGNLQYGAYLHPYEEIYLGASKVYFCFILYILESLKLSDLLGV